MPKFIALEGLCGVGKSTTSALVAAALGTRVTETIPPEFNSLRKHVSAHGSLDARYLVFLAAVVSSAERIQKQLDAGKDVVVESYLYRTIAFHQGMGSQFQISIPKGFLQPTDTIYLLCAHEERQNRLVKRGEEETKWDRLAEDRSTQIEEVYKSFHLPCLDVTSLSPEEACVAVLGMVYGGKQHAIG